MEKVRVIIAAVIVSLMFVLAGSVDAQCSLSYSPMPMGFCNMVACSSPTNQIFHCLQGGCSDLYSSSHSVYNGFDLESIIYRTGYDTIPVRVIVWSNCDSVKMDTCVMMGGNDPSTGFAIRFKPLQGDAITVFSRQNDTIGVYSSLQVSQQPLPTKYILSQLCNTTAIDTPITAPLTYIDLTGKVHTSQPYGFSYCPQNRRKFWKSSYN